MTLRGGGVFCSHPSIIYVNVPHTSVDDKLQLFFKDVGQKCEEIEAASNKIDLQESKDLIIDKIKWFSYASQFMNHLNTDPYMLNENIILMLDNLKLLLRAVQSLIKCQTSLALQLLNICNQFSRLIFIYCVKNPQFKMNSEDQTSISLQLQDIQLQAKQDQQNTYQSTIYYQYLFISMCIDGCPTETQSGQDMTDSFSGFVSSITEMAPTSDLLEFLGKDYKKNQKQQIFKITLYFEELKWQIIEELQNGIGINKILAIMSQNYQQLVLKSNTWIIKCGWIKMICELLIYKPLITKTKYDQLIAQYQLTESWEEAVQQQLINLIDSNQNIGIISNKNVNSRTYKILNVQKNKLEQFKTTMINGHQDIPKLQDLILEQQNEEQVVKDNQDADQRFKQQLDSLPLKQIQQQYQQFIINFQDYSDAVQEIILENDQNASILFDQIEQLIKLNQQLVCQYKELNLNGQILSKQLFGISQTSKVLIKNDQPIDRYLLFCMFLQYFEAIENNQSIIDFDEQLQQFIEKLKSHNYKIFIDTTNEIQQIIKQQKQSNIKQIIIYIKQQIQKNSLNNIPPLNKLTIFIHIQKEFQQIFEQEIRDTLINHQIILQSIKQSRNVQKISKLDHIKFYQLFYFIYQMNTFNNISIILLDLKFDDNTMTELKSNNLSDYITIDFQQYSLDIEDLIHSKNLILDQMQNISKLSDMQENLENLSQSLKHIKQLFIKYEKWLQEFTQHIENYKNILNETIYLSLQQEPQIIKQLKQNYQQIINLSNKKLDSDDLSQIINQRIEIFQNFRSDIQNQDLERLIDKEISFYKFFINDDQIQQVSEQIMIKIELNQVKIIQIIENQQKDLAQNNDQQEQIVQEYIMYFDQIINIIKNLAFLMEKAQQGFQQSSSFVFQLSQFEYSNQSSINDKFMKINQQYNESFQQTRVDVDQNIKEVQTVLNFNPNQLPPTKISNDIIYLLFPCYKKLCGQSMNVEKGNHPQEDDNWRVKEYFYVNCVNIYPQISNQAIKQTIGQLILYGKYQETDIRTITTFKNRNLLVQIQLIISNQYEDTKNEIHSDLQRSLNLLQVLQLQIQGEERKVERDKILQQHKQIEQKIEQQMQNVSEISDVLGISIHFLKETRKEFGLIQNKLDNIIDSIEKIGQDIKFLKGKSSQQLLEIRMEQVLSNQIVQDALSVYVQMQTNVYKPENEEDEFEKQMENDEQTPLFNYNLINTGEVDEFLTQNKKSSLLIHGPAGSGKSLTARKIEELLWKQYQQKVNYQGWDKITQEFTIPIFIYLPALKEPSFYAIEETLKSTEYKFDQKQIDLFRDIVQGSDKIKLLFIMDSYDELAKDYQQINLIQTNNLNQWKKQTSKRNPKVITTSRSEIFNNLEYRPWFYGDDKSELKGFKELRLQPFDEVQRNEFIHQFSWLQLKLLIYDLMEIISKKKQQDIILQDTMSIYYQIKPLIQNKQQSNYLVNNLQAQQVLNVIKQHPNVIAINYDQEISFNKSLQAIWSAFQYNKNIQQVNKNQDLENPFLMTIVAEVLPQMNEKYSSQNYIKSQFQHAYVQNKQAQIASLIKMHSYENQQIQQMYTNDDIKQLQANETLQEIKRESQCVWEYLVNNNFFKQFNGSLGQKEILQLFTNIQNQTKIEFPYQILKKENDADNQIVIYKALTTKNQSLFDIYQVFLLHYIEKHIQKQAHCSQTNNQESFKQEIYQFAQGLAVTLTKSNQTMIEIKNLKQKENNDTDQEKYSNQRQLIIKCLPIKYKSTTISFNHKSIQEFLYAKDIIDLLYQININYKDSIQQLRKQKKDEDSNIYNPIKAKVREFIQQSSLNNVQIGDMHQLIKFVKAAIQYNLELQDACYHLVLISSIFNELTILSSNALVILINVLMCIQDKDFSRILIENINLDGMNFINCNFSESKFKKVSIIGINLNYSNLSKANWIDCYSSDMHTLKCPTEVTCLSICISRLDKLIFCGCSDGFVRIWDRQQGRLLKQIATQSIGVLYVSQSDDGYRFITVSQFYNQEYWLQFWDFESFKLIAQEQTFYQTNCNLISHSKHYVVFPKIDKSLQAYDYVTQKNIKSSFMFEHKIQNLQIKKDTYLVYIVQITEGKIIIWDFYNYNIVKKIQFTELFEEIEMNISCNQFTWDCQLYSYRYNSQFVIFNTETEQNIEIIYPQDKVINFYFSEDKKYIAFSECNGFTIMDAQTQKFITTPQLGHSSGISCIKFNRLSQYLITCGHDSLIKFWDLQMLLHQQNISLQKLSIKGEQYSQYSQDGQKLYVQMNGKLVVYDPFTGQECESFKLELDKFVVRPNGKQMIYHTKQCKTYLYDLVLKQEQELKLKAQKILTQSNDGKLFFYQKFETQSVFYIVIFDESNSSMKQQSQEIEADFGQFSYDSKSLYYLHQQEIKEVKINMDGHHEINIFSQGKFLLKHRGIINFQFTKDCKKLVLLDIDYKLYVWDTVLLKDISDLGKGQQNIQIQILTKYLLIFEDNYIVVFDTQKFKQVGIKLDGHKTGIQQQVISPSGLQFITVGKDNAIKVWDQNKQETNLTKAFIERLIIPQQMNQNALVNNCDFKECEIISHSGYNLGNIWAEE